jgi:hypothetical protein
VVKIDLMYGQKVGNGVENNILFKHTHPKFTNGTFMISRHGAQQAGCLFLPPRRRFLCFPNAQYGALAFVRCG